MGAFKALGPDGYSLVFFQRYWHILGDKVVEAIQGMFEKGKLCQGINHSIICLILKCEDVLVKVVSKVLANRLRPLMVKLTGPFQASFILGRSTVDNVIVA